MFGSLLSVMARGRRVPKKGWKVLTSKDASKFFKGKGGMKAGIFTRTGQFRVLPWMRPSYVVPDLTGFGLKPYVANYPDTEHERVMGPPGTEDITDQAVGATRPAH